MKGKKGNNRGSTMVEVIVAFAVLTIVLACFAEVTSLCLQMVQKASDARMQNEALYASYYTDAGAASGTDIYNGGLPFVREDGTSVTLNVNLRQREYTKDGTTQGSVFYFYVSP